MKSRKVILVAGGAGFVGSNLCGALVARGHKVICVDNLSTGNEKNIKHWLEKKNFEFIKANVTQPLPSPLLKRRGGVQEVYHLASPASPAHYQKNSIATFKANIIGTLNLLEAAKKYGAKFLFASTSEVYGDPLEHPQKESYWGNVNPVGIRSCYDESKRAGESLCADFRRAYGVDAKIARIFNAYGPGMDKNDGRAVCNFIMQAISNRPLTIYGDGKQSRSFQYVDDLVLGLIKMMASSKSFGGPVNLGNPEEVTVLDLAKKIIKKTGLKSKLIYSPLPQDDPKQRKPDISLAENKLGWHPRVKLDEGLERTIKYFINI